MFELYDIETNELIKEGSLMELGTFVNRSRSAVRNAYFRGHRLAQKYKVKSKGVYRTNSLNLYDVYDLESGKKVIENMKASDIAKKIYTTSPQVYKSSLHEVAICGGQYLVKRAH